MNTLVEEVRKLYWPSRVCEVDKDFLSFEEDLASEIDLKTILRATEGQIKFEENPHNSIILYLTGLTDQFDFSRERSDTRGGSPPDIDIDFEALGRERALDWVIEKWGRKRVANIMTRITFKPKMLTRRYFKIVGDETDTMYKVLDKIPKPIFGKEATLTEIVEGNKEKGYPANKQLATSAKTSGWYKFASSLEEMIWNFGVHPAGVIISDQDIPDVVPCMRNKGSEFLTQYDMHECEELGLIKFDFLVINNLDILKQCIQWVNQSHNKEYTLYSVKDGCNNAYRLMHEGYLAGMFQMEASDTARTLATSIAPENISEVSALLALNRPGPKEAGLDVAYVENKHRGAPPSNMPEAVANILKDTYWTLIYQEQIMQLVADLAGFTLRESDDIRRALGKKKMKVIKAYRKSFIEGCSERGIDKSYAVDLWDNTLVGMSNYCFNASHSVAYAKLTYLCAYFKANYPAEFFAALMSVRSQVTQPKKWAQKAPQYVMEARQMGVRIHPPYIQISDVGFSIKEKDVYFGFSAIKNVGAECCKALVASRKAGRYKDIWDFLFRVDRRKVTSRNFAALIKAGAFDTMGYLREELDAKELYAYVSGTIEAHERVADIKRREKENAEKAERREEIDAEVKQAKQLIKKLKAIKAGIPESLLDVANRDKKLKDIRKRVKLAGTEVDPASILLQEELEMYLESIWLRKKPELKPKPFPKKPNLQRVRRVPISVQQLMDQADSIGCYLGKHPARVLYPNSTPIADAEPGDYLVIAGQVVEYREIKTRKGKDMAFVKLGDGTGMAEAVIFNSLWLRLKASDNIPEDSKIIKIQCRVEEVNDTKVKVVAERLRVYQPNT